MFDNYCQVIKRKIFASPTIICYYIYVEVVRRDRSTDFRILLNLTMSTKSGGRTLVKGRRKQEHAQSGVFLFCEKALTQKRVI